MSDPQPEPQPQPQPEPELRPEERVRRVEQETADLGRQIDRAREAVHRALRANSLEGAGSGHNASEDDYRATPPPERSEPEEAPDHAEPRDRSSQGRQGDERTAPDPRAEQAANGAGRDAGSV